MNNKRKIHKCSHCNKTATWLYMPSTEKGCRFFCDDHVPRGCSCNVYDLECDGEPEEDQLGCTIWWNREDYDKCYIKHLNPIEYATKERQPDSFYYEVLDEDGKRWPCCEYDYSPDGYERSHNFYVVSLIDVRMCFHTTVHNKLLGNFSMADKLLNYIRQINDSEVGYNELMSNIKTICYYYIKGDDDQSKLNLWFYRSLRGRIYDKRRSIFSVSD